LSHPPGAEGRDRGIYPQEEKVKIATQFFQEINAALFAPPKFKRHHSHLSGFHASQGVLIRGCRKTLQKPKQRSIILIAHNVMEGKNGKI
jgi:hypothetical protein